MSISHGDQANPSENANKTSYRKHIRLRKYDYRENGYYFVTLCTRNREPLFESVKAKDTVLEKIEQISDYYSGVTVDEVVVMPNHLHFILIFASSKKSLGQVIQGFKSWVTRAWGLGHSIWQPNYFEHVIRNEAALHRIREYIVNNSLVDQVDCDQFYQ